MRTYRRSARRLLRSAKSEADARPVARRAFLKFCRSVDLKGAGAHRERIGDASPDPSAGAFFPVLTVLPARGLRASQLAVFGARDVANASQLTSAGSLTRTLPCTGLRPPDIRWPAIGRLARS
jgi:hypothetical protein